MAIVKNAAYRPIQNAFHTQFLVKIETFKQIKSKLVVDVMVWFGFYMGVVKWVWMGFLMGVDGCVKAKKIFYWVWFHTHMAPP